MRTLGELEREGGDVLRAAGIDNPRHDARLLLQHAAGLTKEALISSPSRGIEAGAAEAYRRFIRRRMGHEPVAYILGCREFWSLDFQVSPAVLIPRPDSETLIEAALSVIPDRDAPLRVLDLGTGSGCLLLSLLSELTFATGLGVDLSEASLGVARQNACALGLQERAAFLLKDWNDLDAEAFDIVLANPPYIPEPDLSGLMPDVRDFEPRLALSGGPDGLESYRSMMGVMGRVLGPGAHAFVELGAGQREKVAALADAHGLVAISAACDLAGVPRCLILRQSDKKSVGMMPPKG